ncbi:hypothetical protein D1818_02610 [Aquimarina sp. BL5]|uniref:hypothetical protein n=1 Tax=Aquimarina sp. BL5 TaxID=1714860 RepID=UPI000E4753B5|nr:hypothetical protein [Aquimarina sp. BL5]AXT49762.1 hypothetical protein D1818_02610 [Aquimarina sp. BL5]RKM96170.1 hypothetical protein D7036_21120 [Aquimarina sp. BL5]
MAQSSFQVQTYSYYNWSSRNTGKTNLILRGSGGQTCSVRFIEDPNAVLPDATQSGSYYSFYYHHNQLQHLIDMLRNESPIYVYFNNDNGFNNSRISTASEPVGEGELN